MRSKIYKSEITENTDKHHNAKDFYYPAYLISQDGTKIEMLFTDAELAIAIDRAEKNPEDWPWNRPWWMFW